MTEATETTDTTVEDELRKMVVTDLRELADKLEQDKGDVIFSRATVIMAREDSMYRYEVEHTGFEEEDDDFEDDTNED